MNFINKIKNILFNPNECWVEFAREKGIKETLKYLAILTLISINVTFIVNIIILKFAPQEKITSPLNILHNTLNLPLSFVFYLIIIVIYLLLFVGLILNSFIIYVFVKIFKGEGGFAETYKAIGYSITPYFLLGSIPIINWFTGLYVFYLQLVGLSKLHKMSLGKAAIISFILTNLFLYGVLFIISFFKILLQLTDFKI